ncbi:glycosyltransferase family 4 protein [Devosia sp.]|uniref:glycosyltransferase family 4 protein n=1 Tax=Devosia sp. TaxID=1871048 RepID=UPI002F0EBD65
MAGRLLIVVNDAEFFVSHRLAVATAARAAGHDVHVATAPGPGVGAIARHGFVHHEVPLSRSGRGPVGEWRAFRALLRLMQRLKPDLVHLVTIKPVLYGGIAARLRRVPGVVVAISGLGHVFTADGARARMLRAALAPLFRFALGHGNIRVIFQNVADREALSKLARLPEGNIVMIRGSGVDLEQYRYLPEPGPPPTVLFASRLLKAKGATEFVRAARLLRERGLAARFRLAGSIDPGNPTTVTADQLDSWRQEGVVEILGQRADMATLLAEAHVVALPSYYGEGVPKVLLEAAACGRAVVTTDHPGCRDAIEPGVTGLLVPVRDADSLAQAIETLLLDPDRRQAMGAAGRRLAEREFGIAGVTDQHLRIYAALERGVAGP